ncbi:MAG: alpha/beta hydrolase [Rhodobacteraceae bacterium]|nr:alpha/beta hydrolase [Paracoccaceae bacterium]
MIEPLVLLPGMMCDARLFSPQINALSVERAVMVAPITLGDRVEEIASGLLDQLPMKFALAGLSMGGIVALELYRRAPERITRLCLMDTTPLAETPQAAAAREPLIIGAKAGRFADVLRDAMPAELLAPGPRRMETLAQMHQIAEELGPDLFVRQSRALQRRRDQQSTLRKIRVPTHIICGKHDPLTPVKRHSFMAELIPGATLQIIEEAGHIPSLETPEIVTAALRSWLDQPLPTG